jgi:hypothetical protein
MKTKALMALFLVFAAWLALTGNASAQLKGTTFLAQRLPNGATQQGASATGAAAAQVQVPLPAVAGQYECFEHAIITSANPTSTVSGVVTVSDGTWTKSYQFVETTSLGGLLIVNLPTPFRATNQNSAITVTLPAITGGAAGAIDVSGYSTASPGC